MKPETEHERYPNPSDDKLQLFCKITASFISPEITPERVRRVIDISNQEGHLFHGIKRYSSLDSIKQSGILPFTPEGGPASYWTSGFRVFGVSLNPSPLNMYDTTFFDYAHSFDPSDEKIRMLIALTNTKELGRLGLDTKKTILSNAYIAIGIPIPRSSIILLSVEEKVNKYRTDLHRVKISMFELIEEVLTSGYKLGDILSVRL
jgi:hypothetical protein